MAEDYAGIELPDYDGLLAGHHRKERGHTSQREWGTDDWLLVATLSGHGRFNTTIGEFPSPPGTLALIAPGTPHDYGTSPGAEGWEILWVHFQPADEWAELLAWPTAAPGVAFLDLANPAWEEVVAAFHEVYRCSITTVRRRRQLAMNALERLLLYCERQLPETEFAMDSRVRAVVEYVHRHLGQPLTLERLSAHVHLSPSRFSHLFRSETGVSPLQYVAIQRMRRARTLLEKTTLSISEVATEIGMDPFHFSTRFKAQTGSSPRAYRTARAVNYANMVL